VVGFTAISERLGEEGMSANTTVTCRRSAEGAVGPDGVNGISLKEASTPE